MSNIVASAKSFGITAFYQEFLENPLEYISRQIYSDVIGVKYFWITRSMLYGRDKKTDKPWDFGVNLEPGVMSFETEEGFRSFIGQSIGSANHMRAKEVPFRYAEMLDPFDYTATKTIILGTNTDDLILYIDERKNYPGDPLPVLINVYNCDGAKMTDHLLAVWFALEEESY